MSKLRILRGFCLGGGHDVYPGDEIDAVIIPARLLRPYILAGKLEPIAEPTADDEEPAPAKKGGKKDAV